MKVAVLGAGNGGCAAALDWGNDGHEVALWDLPQFGKNVEAIAEAGGVYGTGDIEGFAPVAYAGFDLERAMKGAEVILVVGPAYATEPLGRVMADYVTPDQAVVVMPSSCLGAVVLKNALGVPLRDEAPLVGETSTLPYGARADGAHVRVYNKLGGGVWVSALPGSGTERLHALMKDVYPGMKPGDSILKTSLQNANPVIHPAVTLCNASRIENTGGEFRFYDDGVTVASGRLMRAVDDERLAIGERLGITITRDPELGVEQGYMHTPSYEVGFQNAPGFTGIPAQKTLNHRYFNEDVGFGLVFFAELARQIGVEVPTMDALIHIVSTLMERDYRAEKARTLETVGLGDLSLAELRAL